MAAIDQRDPTPPATTGPIRALLAGFEPGEPRAVRGPFTRWPRTSDAALAVVVFAVSLAAVAVSAVEEGDDLTLEAITDQPAGAVALLALAAAALVIRRRHPVGVTVFVSLLMVVWAVAGYGDGQDVAAVVAVYSVGRHTTDATRSLATVALVIAVGVAGTLIDESQRVDIVPAVVVAVVPWYVGVRVRNRGDYLALLRDRAERVEAEQQARARQAVADERARIARELHDLVAHQVSMMTVQAGAAKTIARTDLDTAVEAMGDVERAGRQALGELRHLLGVLRPEGTSSDELGPQPGLAGLAELADELSRTGAHVTSTVEGLDRPRPAALDLSAYRIVQEAVTNVIKHAGPAPDVDLSVRQDGDGIEIDVTNTVTAPAQATLPESGYGIAGMRERAALLGGSLTAAAEPSGRFRVHARLPLDRPTT